MSDRLHELLRQRAAIQAHLTWLDREIAQLRPPATLEPEAPALPMPTTAPAPASPLSGPPLLPTTAEPAVDLDEVLTRYQPDTTSVRSDVRKGCLLYFFGAFVLLALGIGIFSFVSRRFLHSNNPPAPSEERSDPPSGR